VDERGLAQRLRQYAVRSKVMWFGMKQARGYDAADLHDAWTRYLPQSPATSVTSVTTVTASAARALKPASTATPVTHVTRLPAHGANGHLRTVRVDLGEAQHPGNNCAVTCMVL
jgi:Protein of unknown function (DUF3631)